MPICKKTASLIYQIGRITLTKIKKIRAKIYKTEFVLICTVENNLKINA